MEKFNYVRKIVTPVELADFTDNGNATGYVDLNPLPPGAIILGWCVLVTLAFAGTTAATAMVGVSGDTDKFSGVTDGSVVATGKIGAASVVANSADGIGAAVTPRLTVTDAKGTSPDFGDFTAGKATVEVYFIDTRD